MTYEEFLLGKVPEAVRSGVVLGDSEISGILFPHQRDTVRWAEMDRIRPTLGMLSDLGEDDY